MTRAFMKHMVEDQLRKPRRPGASQTHVLRVFIAVCVLVIGIVVIARSSLSSQASANGSTTVDPEILRANTQAKSADGVWGGIGQGAITTAQPQRADLRSYRSVALDQNALTAILRAAPMEFSEAAAAQRSILTLPVPDGTFARFSIAESPVMAPELAARFPEIRTYTGSGIDDPTATTRFDWTPLGFHAIVLSEKGTILIEPSGLGDVANYTVYFQKDVVGGSGECDVTEQDQDAAIARNPKHSGVGPAVVSGTTLRNYRLAVAATAEYTTTYGGGTVSGALSAITTTVNLVDAIYEREVAIRLTLIAGETSIIFTDTATDGYTSDNVNSLIGENQTKLDAVIGSANYDIGHVFDGRTTPGFFSWQGLAGLNVVCVNGAKARGVDIFRSLTPTSVFVYYSAAHEMGHQFGASHTFNATSGSCGGQRSSSTAYEPLNGSTIMAYRLACSPEDLASTDTYFHNASIEQIVNYTTIGGGNSCAVTSATGNNPPVVDAGPVHTIPMGTPFTLTATGSDPDGNALTFGWEEFDLGSPAPPSTDDGSRPIFRSFLPTSSPSRTFPRLQDVLSGFATLGESMPVTTRTMNFRATARDNRTGGGGVNSAATQVNVRADSGPFTVTQPSTWSTGSNQTVFWNIANTNIAPVSCANVKITLSIDGGTTFPIILANNTPNDGSENVTIPGTPSAGGARVKVEAVGNIFFNISQAFSINGSANTVPTISGFAAASGAVGANITVAGTNFINPSAVRFNGVNATFTINSTTQIVATVPAGATTGPITVTTPSGTATSASSFVVSGSTPPTVQFSSSSYAVSETGPSVDISLTRAGDTTSSASVSFATNDGAGLTNCDVINHIASPRCDYENTIGTATWAAGDASSKVFSIAIVDDGYAEGSETFTIGLNSPSGASLGAQSTATVTITDNEATNGVNPIDSTGFFVRQQYIDFLGREPDPAGFAGWTSTINTCSGDTTQCDRIHVSQLFFQSAEFQQRGYFVYRFYPVAFGRKPDYAEFVPDLASVSGFLSDAQLEAAKVAFIAAFMARPAFVSAYNSLNNTQYVDALLNTAGVTLLPSPATRQALIDGLNNATKTRGAVLRQIVESTEVSVKYNHQAYSVMEYFGYLRRQPDGGYLAWIAVLDGSNDPRGMVTGFVNSIEYRNRFGP
jgi:hypothetical protein